MYDGSARGENGISLNYFLYEGPTMIPMLYDVFLKFQVHPIAITAGYGKNIVANIS